MSRQKPPSNLIRFDPSTFRPEFDLIAELTESPSTYRGDSYLGFRSFPAYLRTSLERISHRTPTRPSLSMTTTAAIHGGLHELQGSDVFDRYRSARASFYDLPASTPGLALEQVASWFRSFPLPTISSPQGRRFGVRLTEPLHIRLSDTAELMGTSTAALSILCAAICLAHQPEVNRDHRRSIETAVKVFEQQIAVSEEIGEALVDVLKKYVPAGS